MRTLRSLTHTRVWNKIHTRQWTCELRFKAVQTGTSLFLLFQTWQLPSKTFDSRGRERERPSRFLAFCFYCSQDFLLTMALCDDNDDYNCMYKYIYFTPTLLTSLNRIFGTKKTGTPSGVIGPHLVQGFRLLFYLFFLSFSCFYFVKVLDGSTTRHDNYFI